MRHFPRPLTRAESDALVARFEARLGGGRHRLRGGRAHGRTARSLGMVGLAPGATSRRIDGAIEVGWRLARAHWGQGYATEAARAWLDMGFGALGLAEIVAFTVPANLRSLAVMRRLGMRRDPARDFEHPAMPAGHPLRPHLVFVRRGGRRRDRDRAAAPAAAGRRGDRAPFAAMNADAEVMDVFPARR